MAPRQRQIFPRWWQALILIAAGFLIFFSACAAAFSNFNGPSRQAENTLIAVGLLAGGAMFVAGIILAVVVIILAIARAASWRPETEPRGTSPISFGGRGPITSGASVAPRGRREQEILWNLRIAIIVLMVVASGSFLSVIVGRNNYYLQQRMEFLLVAYILGQVPYIVALIRLGRGADRLGVAIAFATAVVGIVLWISQVLAHFHLNQIPIWLGLSPVVEAIVIVFAWRAGELYPPERDDKIVVGGCFVAVASYLVMLRFTLPLLQRLIVP